MTVAACDTSVIICAYTEDRWNDLVTAITSLFKQTRQPDEIIVVIDHNRRLFERVREQFPAITVLENNAMRGLSGARNTGLAVAHGAYIAFLDDDAEAEPDWLKRLLHCCIHPRVLGAGGMIVPRWQGERPRWFPPEFYWVVGCTYQTLPQVVRNPYGGCACIKREVFQEIGGFREDIGRIGTNTMGGEETELSIRATQRWPAGVFLYEPRARVHHYISIQRTHWSYFLSRCYAEGISKVTISRYVGTRDALASERAYTFRTLPLAVLRNLADALFHRDPTGFMRAGAIVIGLMVTIAGYLKGCIAWSS
jgi:GT2 family glycosyltransferase